MLSTMFTVRKSPTHVALLKANWAENVGPKCTSEIYFLTPPGILSKAFTCNNCPSPSSQEAKCYPVLTFSSGPTNSMRGAAFLTKHLNAIVVDIGGTTTDVGVLVNGFPRQSSTQCEVRMDSRTPNVTNIDR